MASTRRVESEFNVSALEEGVEATLKTRVRIGHPLACGECERHHQEVPGKLEDSRARLTTGDEGAPRCESFTGDFQKKKKNLTEE